MRVLGILAVGWLLCGPGCYRQPSPPIGKATATQRRGSAAKDDVVFIATIAGSDQIAATHIENSLARHGIAALVEGSVFYGVRVGSRDADQALRILKEDVETLGLRLLAYGRPGDGAEPQPVPKTKEQPEMVGLNAPHAEVIRRDAYRPQTALGAVLRSWTLRDVLVSNLVVHSLKVLHVQYRGPGPAYALESGYEVEVRFAREVGGEVTGLMGFQVFGTPWAVSPGGGTYSGAD